MKQTIIRADKKAIILQNLLKMNDRIQKWKSKVRNAFYDVRKGKKKKTKWMQKAETLNGEQ